MYEIITDSFAYPDQIILSGNNEYKVGQADEDEIELYLDIIKENENVIEDMTLEQM